MKLTVSLSVILLATTANIIQAMPFCSGPPSYPVDLPRYLGTWYEIATSWTAYVTFESGCSCVEANYSMNSDGTIRVANSCTDSKGQTTVTLGTAKSAGNDQRPGDFIVSFDSVPGGGNPFGSANYIISEIFGDYEAVVVGGSCYTFMWVLSRTPTLSDAVYKEIMDWASLNGFPLSLLRIRMTKQTECPGRLDVNGLTGWAASSGYEPPQDDEFINPSAFDSFKRDDKF